MPPGHIKYIGGVCYCHNGSLYMAAQHSSNQDIVARLYLTHLSCLLLPQCETQNLTFNSQARGVCLVISTLSQGKSLATCQELFDNWIHWQWRWLTTHTNVWLFEYWYNGGIWPNVKVHLVFWIQRHWRWLTTYRYFDCFNTFIMEVSDQH